MPSPFDLLDKNGEPDLLKEMMVKGKASFVDAKQEAGDELAKLTASLAQDGAEELIGKQPEADEPATNDDENKDPGNEPPTPPPSSSEDPESKYPDYVHSLNEGLSATRQKQDAIERALQQQNQYLQQIAQKQNQPATPQQEDYTQYGFEDPEAYEKLLNRVRQETWQQQAPLFHQAAADRFIGAVSRLEKEHEHFKEYFPREVINNWFNGLVQKYGPHVAAQVNFDQELLNAYAAADYPRVSTIAKKANEQQAATNNKKQEVKKEQKANLHLVAKANQQGDPPGKKSLADELSAMDTKASFSALARSIKTSLYG